MTSTADRLRAALDAPGSSARLQAALDAGTRPHDEQVDVLVERCAVESDFYVRDMLTWALVRHPADVTVPILIAEVEHGGPQACSQALHTLSKIGDPRGWNAITPEVLTTDDEQIARTAWRAAVVLAPAYARADLAARLVAQLARGSSEMQRSLSHSLASLGDATDAPLTAAIANAEPSIRQHAIATRRLMLDPDEAFDAAMFEAERIVAGLAP